MGNYKFRLSDMMPNAWFYKLKDMSRVRNSTKKRQSTSTTTTTTTTNSSQNSKKSHHNTHSRKSYHFTRDLTKANPNERFYNSPSKDLPRKSFKNRAKPRKATCPSPKLVSSTVSSGFNCRTKFSEPHHQDLNSLRFDYRVHGDAFPSLETEFRSDSVLPTESSFDDIVSLSSSCTCGVVSSSDKDIIINVDKNSLWRRVDNEAEEIDSLNGYELPPINTKPGKFHDDVKNVKKKRISKDTERKLWCKSDGENNTKGSLSGKEDKTGVKEKNNKNSPVRRRFSVSYGSPGVRLRINSPKVASRKLQGSSRKSNSSSSSTSSFAIVKASHDPQRDFQESMMEMIVENNIRESKDLEDLLACYLTLNSDEYHDLIIKVFKQIWFDLAETRL